MQATANGHWNISSDFKVGNCIYSNLAENYV
jgi:hypothetical protein